MRAKTEAKVGGLATAMVVLGAMSSLGRGEAPQGTASLEGWIFVGMLPSSLISSLIRGRDQDSIAFWLVAVVLWAVFAFFQFRVLAALPR